MLVGYLEDGECRNRVDEEGGDRTIVRYTPIEADVEMTRSPVMNMGAGRQEQAGWQIGTGRGAE